MLEVLILTRRCPVCGAPGEVTMRRSSLKRWRMGAMLQEAAPELNDALREQVLSGVHPACWSELVNEDDDEEVGHE